jgi:hypothetical protein
MHRSNLVENFSVPDKYSLEFVNPVEGIKCRAGTPKVKSRQRRASRFRTASRRF